MRPFEPVHSPTVVFDADNVDTDQIIPARFLVATDRGSWGDKLFADRPQFPRDAAAASGAQILVCGRNFGCGSSREHAAWALRDFGFRAVIATSFADIFRANALKNGLVPVAVPADVHKHLVAARDARLTVDVGSRTLTLDDGTSVPFALDDFSRTCLLRGVDELGYLQKHEAQIDAYEKSRTTLEEVSFS